MGVDSRLLSSEEWEEELGARIRAVRIEADLGQRELAEAADISIGAVQNLEGGKGSSIATLVKVVRALDRTDWIEGLAPAITVSPMAMLRSHGQAGTADKPRRRVSRRRR